MSSANRIPRVVQLGLGPIGLGVVKGLLSKKHAAKLVGAVDVDSEKVGRDVARLAGIEEGCGVVVSDSLEQVLAATSPDVVVHCTSSHLPTIVDQLKACIDRGVSVVSSSEELFYPWDRHAVLAAQIDQWATEGGATILGTGVNPGFSMDTLALVATGTALSVSSVEISRRVDAGRRRLPLQKKVGAGLTVEEFERLKSQGKLGHVGLVESLKFVAQGLGWKLDSITENLDPVVATGQMHSDVGEIPEGGVAGIHHTAGGFVGGQQVLSLDLKMFVGAGSEFDAVRVDGDPPVDLIVRDGIFGDTATVAALINAIPLVLSSAPGLRTMKDMPIPRAFGTLP